MTRSTLKFQTYLILMLLSFGICYGYAMSSADIDKKLINSQHAPKAIGPYSQAIVANGFIFVSGQVPINPATGEVVSGPIENQVEQSLKNIKAILKTAGTSMKQVVKATVFLADLNHYKRVNKVYSKYFSPPYPARAAVQVARLPLDVLVEIEVIALIPKKK